MNKEQIIKHLEGLADGSIKPKDFEYGLCYELVEKFEVRLKDLVDVTKYPEFSGNKHYPIKSKIKAPNVAYHYSGGRLKWLAGKYADNRKKFCKWVAEELRNESL